MNGNAITDDGVDAPTRPAPSSRRRVTIGDVAREAGVSTSAVSKVLRDAYGVSPSMRQRVTHAIDTLGYRPHAGARAMRGRTYTIGVVLTELSSPFQTEVAQRIGAHLGGTPYQELLIAAGTAPSGQLRAVEALVDRGVDGLILVAPHMDIDVVDRIAQRIPTVCVALHGPSDSFDTVADDDELGARLMVDHLVALGHRRIAHTSQTAGELRPPFRLSHTARREGYAAAMKAHSLEPWIIDADYSEQGGYLAAKELFDTAEPPTAIFAGADIAALGVLRAAHEQGLRVPADVSVTGYDDIFAAGLADVGLTTIDQSSEHTGATAAQYLLERLDGRVEPMRHREPPRLVARRTSATLAS
ncbi:LacI family DNA-binding transcriptional regulator [Demequina sp.]|uniref:LacI family DNA-binding transcriptional regulator n=1 Tax=Demequina sp. TaxID=2050685 RepID=UPI003A8ABEB1